MRISTSESIARIPILEVRRLLRAVVDSLSIGAVSRVLAISERQAKALVKELELREMLKRDGDRWGITVKGGALALASAAKPLTRQTAERLVNGLYTRTVEVNRNPRFLFQVREVRLFGSYLSNASQLGDVDVALDVASKLPHDGHRVERSLFIELGAEVEERAGSWVSVFLFDEVRVFHRPHPSPDTDKGAVASIRKWLEQHGVEP